MTKETMIWQTCSIIIAGYVMNKTLPVKEEFESSIIRDAQSILDYTEQDIKHVLHTTNCTEFAEILVRVYANNTTNT